jgi:hypothetical protein
MTGVATAKSIRVALVCVLLAGAAVRIWGFGFGLPLTRAHPDESLVARTSIEIARGNLDPGFFNYPTLFMYATGAAYRAYCWTGPGTGGGNSTVACLASWPVHWEPFFLIGRALSVLAGTVTVWLIYRLGRRVFDPLTGVVAAGFLAVAFLHVRDSHFGVTDVSMTMLVVAAVLALVRAHDGPAPERFAWAGLLAGLAASTKYNALLLAAPLLASQWLQLRDERRADGRIPVFLAAMACGFLAGTPFALIDRAQFWRDASSEAAHLTGGHGIRLGIGWRYHLLVSLWHGLTWPLLAAALAGMIWMCIRAPRRAVLLLAFPVIYYAVAGRGYTVFARYMVPVVPFLCVTAAYFACRAAHEIEKRFGPGRLAAATIIIALSLGMPTIVQVVRFDRVLGRVDSRVLASQWIRSQVPNGASVYLAGGNYGSPDLGGRGSAPPYRMWEFDESRGRFDTPSGLTNGWPEWIVVQESPLLDYSRVPAAVGAGLARYDLRRAFHVVDMQAPHVYDQQDAFFLPLAGLSGIGRPGPNIYIYQRRDESDQPGS